jgi:hypothetical protein
MKELVEKVKQLAQQELENSYKKFPKFNSAHKGYAVLMEEFEEAEEIMPVMNQAMHFVWKDVRTNEYHEEGLKNIVNYAAEMAA